MYSKVHKEIARDAWYYMEHSSYATQRQKDAIKWFFANFNRVEKPWNTVAEGAVWPDRVRYVCFVGWTHKTGSEFGQNFTSWFHFLDMYSAFLNYKHSRHPTCGNFNSLDYKGEHNSYDGYNYRRHEETIAGYGSDWDFLAAWWIDDDNLCLQHGMKTALKWYEYYQGGKGANGLLLGSDNHQCYTQWDDDNPNSDFWNMIFAPIDNVLRAYYQMAVGLRNYLLGEGSYICNYEGIPLSGYENFYQERALFHLGAALHLDACIFHHIVNSIGWGHKEFESWAEKHYDDQTWFQDQHQEIKNYIESYYREDGIDPIDRPIRWLVHKLAWTIFNQESMDAVWDRYVDKDDWDSKYDNFCKKVYPPTVALSVIIMEKFYKGKEETFKQQAYDHAMSENTVSDPTTPPVKVKVKKFKLIDETNPEFWWSDEIYGNLTVEDGIVAENHRIPSSGHYSMDEGDSININKNIFETSHVGNYLMIKAEIWEVDHGTADDLVGKSYLYFPSKYNWGKGRTHRIECKYPYADGRLDVYVEVE